MAQGRTLEEKIIIGIFFIGMLAWWAFNEYKKDKSKLWQHFQGIEIETSKNIFDDESNLTKKLRKVILCSGKIYHDLKKQKDENDQGDIAIIRLEQLYPFPYKETEKILNKYKNASEFIWCQEEPRNQGAWYGQRHRLNRVLNNIGLKKEFRLMSRPPSSAPAVVASMTPPPPTPLPFDAAPPGAPTAAAAPR